MSNKSDKHSLKTRWVMRRNAILGSARFQRWASRTPIIRGIARRKAAAQFDLVAGFIYSQILLAHVQSGLIGFLTGGLRSFDEISAFLAQHPVSPNRHAEPVSAPMEQGRDSAPWTLKHVQGDEEGQSSAKFGPLGSEAVSRLLRAGASLHLTESPQPGFWTLGEAGAALSVNAGAMAMIRHHPLLYRDLVDPLALLAKGRSEETALSAFWSYASRDSDRAGSATLDYSALMAATQPMVAGQALDAYDFSRHRHMLDIGGGSGGFTQQVMAAAPDLHFGIFDLPEVIDGAESRLAAAVAQGRVTFHRGSFKTDALPHGYDLITMCRIAHDHDDDVVAALLAAIHAALPANGHLLIIEPLAETASATRMGDAYFGLYLWAMGSGQPRSESRLRAMLAEAGFSHVKAAKTGLPIITSLLVASR